MADQDYGVTKTVNSDDLDLRKYRNKWQNKQEFELVQSVRSRQSEFIDSRRTSCPWAQSVSEQVISGGQALISESGSGTGSSWKARWDEDYKLWSMHHEYVEGRSNLKSPTTFAPIEAFMADFQENRIGLLFTPTQEQDKGKVKLFEEVNKYWENKAKIDVVNNETMKECAITGSSFRHITWQKVEREVELIQGSSKVTEEIHQIMRFGSRKEKAKVKKQLEEQKKPLSKKTTVIDFDDAVHIPVSNYEMLWDGDAREVRAPAYEATDCEWRQLPSLEQFLKEFRNSSDPYVIKDNVEKVVGADQAEKMYEESAPFFSVPSDIMDSSRVELLKYFNKSTDKYIIIANDVLIRDGPLPFNHKQLPFALHRFIKWPNQFYGVGMAVTLESLQAEDETLRNMMLEQLKLEINPPLFIPYDMYEDVDTGWERVEPGLKVPVSGDPSTIQWLKGSGYKPNYAEMRKSIESDALKASGINPLVYSMPRPYEAVRTNIMAMESSLKMIKKGIRNWAEGYREARLQTIALMRQFYPDSYIDQLNPETGEVDTIPRYVVTQGKALREVPQLNQYGMPEMNEDQTEIKMTIQEEVTKPEETHRFELKNEYLDLDGDIDVMIDVDTLVPMSKGLQLQNAEKFMAQLVPILANPQMAENPGITALVRYYSELNGVPKELIRQLRDEPTKKDIERATEQNKQLIKGEAVASIPGESTAHVEQHRALLSQLIAKYQQMRKDPTVLNRQLTDLDNKIAGVSEHIEGDNVPKQMGAEYAVKQGQGLAQQGMPQQGPPQGMPPQGPPAMQGVPPRMPPQGVPPELILGANRNPGPMPAPGPMGR